MPLCQLFINKNQQQFMLMKIPDEVNPNNYQGWVAGQEQGKDIQAFEFSQQLLDRIALSYIDDRQTDDPYQAKYVLMKAPEERSLFVSSLEISHDGEEKLDIVRNGLLIVFDEDELKRFTPILQQAWNEDGVE